MTLTTPPTVPVGVKRPVELIVPIDPASRRSSPGSRKSRRWSLGTAESGPAPCRPWIVTTTVGLAGVIVSGPVVVPPPSNTPMLASDVGMIPPPPPLLDPMPPPPPPPVPSAPSFPVVAQDDTARAAATRTHTSNRMGAGPFLERPQWTAKTRNGSSKKCRGDPTKRLRLAPRNEPRRPTYLLRGPGESTMRIHPLVSLLPLAMACQTARAAPDVTADSAPAHLTSSGRRANRSRRRRIPATPDEARRSPPARRPTRRPSPRAASGASRTRSGTSPGVVATAVGYSGGPRPTRTIRRSAPTRPGTPRPSSSSTTRRASPTSSSCASSGRSTIPRRSDGQGPDDRETATGASSSPSTPTRPPRRARR